MQRSAPQTITLEGINLAIAEAPDLPRRIAETEQSLKTVKDALAVHQHKFDQVQVVLIPEQLKELSKKNVEVNKRIETLAPLIMTPEKNVAAIKKRIESLQKLKSKIAARQEEINELVEENNKIRLAIQSNNTNINKNFLQIVRLSPLLPIQTRAPHVDAVQHGNHTDYVLHQPLSHHQPHYVSHTPVYASTGATLIHSQDNHHNSVNNPTILIEMQIQSLRASNQFLVTDNGFKEAAIVANGERISQLKDILHEQEPLSNNYWKLDDFTQAIKQKEQELAPIQQKLDEYNSLRSSLLKERQDNIAEQTRSKTQFTLSKQNLERAGIKEDESLKRESTNVLGLKLEAAKRDIEDLEAQDANILREKARLDGLKTDYDNNLLISNPAVLVERFVQTLHTSLIEYEDTHANSQSIFVRQCLIILSANADCIADKSKLISKEDQRHAFYLLCGMVSVLQDYISGINDPSHNKTLPSSKAFMIFLATLQNYSIHANKILVISDNGCAQLYTQLLLLDNFAGYKIFPINKLQEYEAKNFEQAWHALRLTADTLALDINSKLYTEITDVLDEARRALEEFSPAVRVDKYKFFTKIIVDAHEAVKANVTAVDHYDNKARADSLQRLAGLQKFAVPGASSSLKRIIGVTLMLLGTLLTVASAKAAAYSFGVLAPYAIPGMVAGGSLCLTGAGFFYSGRQKGLAKELVKLNAELNANKPKVEDKPPAYSLVAGRV
jgi:hypothetical protein